MFYYIFLFINFTITYLEVSPSAIRTKQIYLVTDVYFTTEVKIIFKCFSLYLQISILNLFMKKNLSREDF